MTKAIITLVSVLMLFSCQSDDSIKNDINTKDVDLYFTGLVKNSNGVSELKYWKNDSVVAIPVTQPVMPTSIGVQGKDVFVAGYLHEDDAGRNTPINGVIWKNSNLLYTLKAEQGQRTIVNAMKVENNTIHAAGVVDFKTVAYWKNGVYHKWATSNLITSICAMEVSGNDVYILGDQQLLNEENNHVIKYWKNGVEYVVSDPNELSYPTAIKVIGDNVYVLGTVVSEGTRIALWKNGVRTIIGDSYIFGYASDLYIEDNNIYVSANMQFGNNITPLLFKNGSQLPVEYQNNGIIAMSSLYVYKSNIYALGLQGNNGVIWNNGKIFSEINSVSRIANIIGVPKD